MALFRHPEQYELWADLSLQNAHLRRNNWMHWGVHLTFVTTLVLVSTRPLPAIRVDQLGRAQLVEDVPLAGRPGPEEAEAFTQLFSKLLLEVTSGSVRGNLAKALAMMTSDFRRAYLEKVKGDASLPLLDKGNVRTELSFDEKQVQIKVEKDAAGLPQRYFAELAGRLDVYQADVFTAPLLTRQVRVRATLLVAPRTYGTLNGLLVDFFEKEYLEAPKGPSLNVSPLPTVTPSSNLGGVP